MHVLPIAHTLPQRPQLSGSRVKSASQPLPSTPSQLPNPASHAVVHMLALQARVMCGAPVPGHTTPQPPQLFTSLAVVAQPVAQHVWPGAQVGPPAQPPPVHMLPTHICPGPHTNPQPPQLAGSLVSSTHTPPQLVCPSGHTMPPQPIGPGPTVQHADIMQTGAPGGHATKHPPQFVGSAVVSTHVSPQHVRPIGQPVTRQPPPVHVEPTHI